jgi:hypothetical protein
VLRDALRILTAAALALLGIALLLAGVALYSWLSSGWMFVVSGVGLANVASARRLLRWHKAMPAAQQALPVAQVVR